MSDYNQIQTIKRNFFAMRNGIVADTIRQSGLQYKMVFGLNLPQLVEIAASTPRSAELAELLWADRRTRESMMLAPMIYPPEQLTMERCIGMLGEAPTVEVADILCHRLLRHRGDAFEIACEASRSEAWLTRYGALRLLFNLLYQRPEDVREVAESHLEDASSLCRRLSQQMIDEIDAIAGASEP